MLSVRNSCYERKGKAYSFISEGFAFDIRPSPTKAEDLFQESPSYLLLSDLRQSNDETALKLPFSMFAIMQSGFKCFKLWELRSSCS